MSLWAQPGGRQSSIVRGGTHPGVGPGPRRRNALRFSASATPGACEATTSSAEGDVVGVSLMGIPLESRAVRVRGHMPARASLPQRTDRSIQSVRRAGADGSCRAMVSPSGSDDVNLPSDAGSCFAKPTARATSTASASRNADEGLRSGFGTSTPPRGASRRRLSVEPQDARLAVAEPASSPSASISNGRDARGSRSQ